MSNTVSLAGSDQLGQVYSTLGIEDNPYLGCEKMELLRQILVAVSNRTGGGGGSYLFGRGLTLSGSTVNADYVQDFTRFSNLTSNGLVTTSGGNGTLGISAISAAGLSFIQAADAAAQQVAVGLVPSQGGNGAGDDGKIAQFSALGSLNAFSFSSIDGVNTTTMQAGGFSIATADGTVSLIVNAPGSATVVLLPVNGNLVNTGDTGTVTSTMLAGSIAPSKLSVGTGVATALGVNVGSAGAFVVNGGALGTPASGTLTSCTGLPVSTGISGLGTSVATALAVAVGSAGAFVTFNGAGGAPSSLTLTNATGLPSAGITGAIAAAKGGTGVANGASCTLTLPNAATTISTGGTIALGGFTLTVPATGTAALIDVGQTYSAANTFTAGQTFARTAVTGSPAASITVTTPADTALTASTENIVWNKTAATRQFATGALTTQREVVFAAPTYGFVGASTLTTAINVDIADPIAGTNGTLTNKYGLRVNNMQATGTITAVTGINNPGSPLVIGSCSYLQSNTGKILFGTQAAPTGCFEAQTTSGEAFRARYDASNYFSITQSATTGVTFASIASGTAQFTFSQAVNLNGLVTIGDAINFVLNATTGTKWATATTQKQAWWNAAPVVQPAHIADPSGGAIIDAEARTAINAILAWQATLGLTAAS